MFRFVFGSLLVVLSSLACGQSDVEWTLTASVYTTHFSPKPIHNNDQGLVGIERRDERNSLWGAATFLNSFNQRSSFVFHGRRFDFETSPFYAKVMGGFIHGYRGEYRKKVPLNYVGISPVVIPTAGFQLGNWNSELVLLGTNAMMVNMGWSL